MKIFKFCLLPILLLAVAVFVAGFFCPEHWEVEVHTTIDAAPEEIHPFIEDLRQWPEWTAWGDEFSFTFEGAEKGVGAIATSTGGGSNVRWEITASDPQKGVWFDELLEGTTREHVEHAQEGARAARRDEVLHLHAVDARDGDEDSDSVDGQKREREEDALPQLRNFADVGDACHVIL